MKTENHTSIAGRSIARRLHFNGPQSSYYGAKSAAATPMRGGDFVGDTRSGGSCNASVLTLNPHCNGTHTECVGHITDERHDVIDVLPHTLWRALLISLPSRIASDTNDSLPAAAQPTDYVLTEQDLLTVASGALHDVDALIVRTLPNAPDKAVQQYSDNNDYPYFTIDAMARIVEANIAHLLIDTPSLDRLDDGGRLTLHRQFWNMSANARAIDEHTRNACTITEMIYVDNDINDARYRLSFQPAPFTGDAVPSNPVLYPMGEPL